MKNVEISVEVDSQLKRLLKQEDLDRDFKITIDDPGPKHFVLKSEDGESYEILGTYPLSNLLQILAYAHHDLIKLLKLNLESLYLNPVDFTSKQIRTRYWSALTRTLDNEGILKLLEDTKHNVKGKPRIYVSHADDWTFEYFKAFANQYPNFHLEVVQLPKDLTKRDYMELDLKPGLLALEIDPENRKGKPFIVPGGRFNEMYGWDSYFIVLGLLKDQQLNLALSILDNLIYQIKNYKGILNANRTYYLSRSSPPLLTSIIREILEVLPSNIEQKDWLFKSLGAAIEEYQTIWTSSDRLTSTGLSRYYGQTLKEPIEVEEGHYDFIYNVYAEKLNISVKKLRESYLEGTLKSSELDRYFVHDRAMRESGHDTSNRLINKCADLNTVDLNSLLYKYEKDISFLIQKYFEGHLVLKGKTYTAQDWENKADKRVNLMNQYMWNDQEGQFFDYDFKKKKQTHYESATTFYPLFAGLATSEQARVLLEKTLNHFECLGGISSTTSQSRKKVDKLHPQRQWDYPFGWAPHQILFWKGASQYGYPMTVKRLAYRWLYMLTKEAADYNGTIVEKYDVTDRSHKKVAEYGNVGQDFHYFPNGGFAWSNASYQVGLDYLSIDLKNALKKLRPPEDLFECNL